MPTAAAVMSDVVAVIKNMHRGVTGSQFVEPRFEKQLKEPEQRVGEYYLRFHAKDEAGVFKDFVIVQ